LDKVKKLLGITPDEDKTRDTYPFEETEVHSSKPVTPNIVNNTPEPFEAKAKDFIKGTFEEVKQQGSEIWESVKDGVEQIDQATQPLRDKIGEKAKEVSEKIESAVESALEKAKILEAQESIADKDKDGLSDHPIDFGKSVTEKHGDFFEKAKDWLDKNEEAIPEQTVPSIENDTQKPITPLELPKE
jgi:hypothetical protein